ncbi:low molecular weight protein arginine phosphatase [Listeria cossartiae subsp. cayugensis]|uniref:low molecular weight protein arginine phosphatase n=1 Tax=Listeria cossartiae TaxID=2838249 RepID=UPI00287FFFB9|nr:low molecular weight protein arginine phosphatase [Listeria cossartiae]MDT0001546.1 low molecular weight protein arginine phosphatase [Listeria cossartiae subsp. cayugensis]MDT0009745.1 low molecular weight protein arginine phosphatase [Listeria cossartiae subsp. cayugensis]MDT0031576.1 low molecular weight protein arginine phosphatase [Listeria cossartiae subsp. cayugensis]MDT0039692.1 low molecular weight protein arginine phosphatase [Listeria cossartiae subsp. cayugensis]MDT0045042.1 low
MNILFVCTGNTCRSPLAEKILQNLRPDLDVRSAGTRALDGDAISENSRQILTQMNLPTTHTAEKITQNDIDWADQIYVMTQSHQAELKSIFQKASDKIQLISEDGTDIPDPYGGPIEQYEITYYELKSAISERFL